MLAQASSESSLRAPGTRALRAWWRWAVAGTVIAASGVLLSRTAPWGDIADAAGSATSEPLLLSGVAGAYSAAFLLRAVAWRFLFHSRPGAGTLFSILQTCLFLNHLFPFKAGDVSRPALAAHRGIPAGEAIATTLVARALDFVGLALLVAIAFPAAHGGGSAGTAAVVAGTAVAAGCGGLLALRRWPITFGPEAIREQALALHRSLRAIRTLSVSLAAPLVLASWLLESAVLLGAARLLGIDVSLQLAVGVTAFTILFQAVHFTPGGIGVYETAMTTALVSQSIATSDAIALAVLTHGLKFAYSFAIGGVFAAGEAVHLLRGKSGTPAKAASRVEVVAARLWNVVNEGKPFTIVFTLAIVALLSIPHLAEADYWPRAALSLLAAGPLALVFYRFDFPLRLRAALWVYLAAFVAVTRVFPLETVLLVLGTYFGFTVVLWGTIYYHLRIGTPWTNGFRFVRLVAENPDPTSGNFLEQVPKALLLVLLFQFGLESGAGEIAATAGITSAAVGISAVLLHQWFFTWVPALPQAVLPLAPRGGLPARRARRVIAIVIDGCRDDRLREANTPFIDGLRARGIDVAAMNTVYPARTVTCFSSMLSGAPPVVHGMRSNFVPSLGIKCESVFDVLRTEGLHGKMVGIAHLLDAFGESDVAPVTAVMHNDEIDAALVERAKRVLREENPELLVLQLLTVDQTGHARGSYNAEYLAKIEETDRTLASFLGWCEVEGYLEEAMVLVTADHGQGIGIGGHGHMSPPEIRIPCIISGAGVKAPRVDRDTRFITDIAATICAALGVRVPSDCVGGDLVDGFTRNKADGPVVFVVPARNEAARLPGVLAAIAASSVSNREVVVVDDGSTDETAAIARASGAFVVSHHSSRGLGASVRTGLAAARSFSPRAVVYLDADGEYDAREAPKLLEPLERGEADYVLGSRFGKRPAGMTHSRRFANRAFSLLLSVCSGRWVEDGQTGFRAFSPRALQVAEIAHDYNYAQVLTLDLLRKGMRMKQIPITYRRRAGGRSFISAQYLWRVPVGMAKEMLSA